MKSKDKQLTSVKIHPDLYLRFRTLSPAHDMNLQKLVDRAMYLYLSDASFQQKIRDIISVDSF
jgi:hypothetical protein